MQKTLACIKQELQLFFTAVQFFTRLPIPRWVGFQPEWLQHAARYFPLAGLVVALPCCVVYLLSSFLFPLPVAVVLSTVTGVYVTGAFHEDGFADSCDGLGGGQSTERVLEIMKDSRIGTYGAVGMGLMLALKCLALAYLPSRQIMAALLLAHPCSRLAAASLIRRLDYVRVQNSKAKPIASNMTAREFGIACSSCLIPVLGLVWVGWLGWPVIVIALLSAGLISFWMAKKLVHRIGGYTGDALGAVQQLSELAIYLAILACVQHGF
jgi:adenosylcobinamide-GDP ribazoletransferase